MPVLNPWQAVDLVRPEAERLGWAMSKRHGSAAPRRRIPRLGKLLAATADETIERYAPHHELSPEAHACLAAWRAG